MIKTAKPRKSILRVRIKSNLNKLKCKVVRAEKLIDEIKKFKIVVTTDITEKII